MKKMVEDEGDDLYLKSDVLKYDDELRSSVVYELYDVDPEKLPYFCSQKALEEFGVMQ